MSSPKFRAWFKQSDSVQYMNEVSELYFDEVGLAGVCLRHELGFEQLVDDLSKIELMQSTGLADMDYEEIYEGDILCHDFVGGVDTYVIERNPDDNQLHAKYLYMSGNNTDYLGETPTSSSVIVGNIFQNPELLNGD